MPENFLKNYFKEICNIFAKVSTDEFSDFLKELVRAHKNGARVFVCGNGGSAATASHFACDINKNILLNHNRRFKVISLVDNLPTILAYANDLSYEDIFAEQLKNFMKKGDLVVGISASGNSKNVLKAIMYANKYGGRTFGVCGNDGGKLKNIAQKSIIIRSKDMQKIEDLHLIILHCAMQWLNKFL